MAKKIVYCFCLVVMIIVFIESCSQTNNESRQPKRSECNQIFIQPDDSIKFETSVIVNLVGDECNTCVVFMIDLFNSADISIDVNTRLVFYASEDNQSDLTHLVDRNILVQNPDHLVSFGAEHNCYERFFNSSFVAIVEMGTLVELLSVTPNNLMAVESFLKSRKVIK